MNLQVTCECGTEYDLNYVEDRDGTGFTYDACPDCGVLIDSTTVAEAVAFDPNDEAEYIG